MDKKEKRRLKNRYPERFRLAEQEEKPVFLGVKYIGGVCYAVYAMPDGSVRLEA